MHGRSVGVACLLGLMVLSPSNPGEVAAQEARRDTLNPAVEVGREILRVLRLPRMADSIRDAGIPAEEVEEVFRTARAQRVPASETVEVFQESLGAIRENGPMDNFGAFVQSQLAAGLRGRELAAAIHAEHARRGIGKGRKLDKVRGDRSRGEGQGRKVEGEERGNRGGGPVKRPGRGGRAGNGAGR